VRYRTVGASGLELSVIGLGGYELGTGGHPGFALEGAEVLAPERIDRTIRAALDDGVNWIDTAEEYHDRGNESAIGDALRRLDAGDKLVCTKLWPAPDGSGFDRQGVHRGIRGSLERLGRDHADVFLLHMPDDEIPIEETWAAMQEVREQGLARAVGLSNHERPVIERALSVGPVDVVQEGLSMVDYMEDRELIAWCGRQGIAAQVYEPLGSSMLTGAITRDTDVDALWGGHLKEWSLFGRLFEGGRFERSMTVVDGLRQRADAWGASVPQLAIAWVLAQPGVTAAIAGTTSPDHAASNAAAGDLELSADQLAELESLVPLGPAFV
jgi:aryl-alcohol dehydrogenase-like predicted oxidoreductase